MATLNLRGPSDPRADANTFSAGAPAGSVMFSGGLEGRAGAWAPAR